MFMRNLWLGVAVFALSSCASVGDSKSLETVVSDVQSLLDDWASSLSEERIEDFKALYTSREGFIWAERGQFIYRSADDIAAGIDTVLDSGMTFTNRLSDVTVTPLSNDAASFSARVTSEASGPQFSFTFDGILTGVAVREEGGWKLFQGHLSEPD